jgi:hypothetical protein
VPIAYRLTKADGQPSDFGAVGQRRHFMGSVLFFKRLASTRLYKPQLCLHSLQYQLILAELVTGKNLELKTLCFRTTTGLFVPYSKG